MKLKTKNCVRNRENTIALVEVEKFEGQSTTITLDYMKKLTEILTMLAEMGFEKMELGIENDTPLLLFLDKEKRTALAIAPQIEAD